MQFFHCSTDAHVHSLQKACSELQRGADQIPVGRVERKIACKQSSYYRLCQSTLQEPPPPPLQSLEGKKKNNTPPIAAFPADGVTAPSALLLSDWSSPLPPRVLWHQSNSPWEPASDSDWLDLTPAATSYNQPLSTHITPHVNHMWCVLSWDSSCTWAQRVW